MLIKRKYNHEKIKNMKLKDKINTAEEYKIILEEKLRLEAYLDHITKLLRAYIYQEDSKLKRDKNLWS
jgi:hypothetical protein